MMLDLDGYQEVDRLYVGSRTLVYRATRNDDLQPAIIKVLRNPYPDFNELVRFRNQYIITRHLEHPTIVRPTALERHNHGYALVMPDEGAIALSDYWQSGCQQRSSGCNLVEFLAIAIQLAEALHYLSQQSIVHKDIKPANILIHPETRQVRLIDFSISSLLPKERQQLINPNVLEGTLAYISPEQTGRTNRGIDYRTDFYSLGATFFELLTGQLPFATNDPMELVHCHIAQAVRFPLENSLFDVPEALQAIALKLMEKNAEDRYQSALGLKHDLERCLQQSNAKGTIEPFELGERDACDRFLIPEKLYGREVEVQALLDAFARVANPPGDLGRVEMMLVAGFSGIGKTAVVNEVHKPIVKQRGYFIKGKYDQFNRNIPFSAFVRAFRDLMEQLLGESDVELAAWRAKILEAVGENGQVMIDVIPELERIIGQQTPVPELSGSGAQNRFNLLFGQFVRVLTTKEHPLVIFLDDLQWADSASLNLLKLLANESDAGYLLVLGSYRDNEVSPTHTLMLALDEIQKQGANLHTLTLTPLGEADITRLVADTLQCSIEIAAPLSRLVYQKTQGNPFFTTQFLKGLHEEGCITFDPPQSPLRKEGGEKRYRSCLGKGGDRGGWQCDLTRVQRLALTDDVVAFVVGRLQKLPEATQEVLKLAACIGDRFDLATLAVVCEKTQEEIATDLWRSLQEGFVVPESQTYKLFQGDGDRDRCEEKRADKVEVGYHFLHDRVQQAAYSLIAETQKQVTHYRIGKRLLAHLSPEERDEKIFDIVNQINIGRNAIAGEIEKKKLVELNFNAGQKAKASTAYDAAKIYFKVGIDLLADNAWTADFDLAFELHLALAEAQLMSVDFDSLEKTIATLLEFAKSPLDRAKIYVLKVNQYSLQGPYSTAIQAGLVGLQELGITVCRDTLKDLVREDSIAIEKILEERSLSSLLDLPEGTNPEAKVAIELLMNLLSAAYISSDIDLYGFTIVRNLRLSIEHGNVPKSITAYVNYGEWLGLTQHQYQRGVEFADIALQLSYKLKSKSQQSSACFLLGGCIHVKAKPIQGAAEINYEGFLAGMDSGELQYAGYNLFANIYNRLFQGENLATIAADLDKYWAIAEKIQNDLALSVLAACRFFIHKLAGELDDRDGDRASVEERAWIERHQAARSYLPLGIYNILHMHEACLNRDFARGIDYGTEARKFLTACSSCTTATGYYYYGPLNLLGSYSNLNEDERKDALHHIEADRARLKILSESCPENFLHKYLLVEAERSRILGKKLEAMELYDRAISEAKTNQYLHEEALANEFAATFYLGWGKEKIAAAYMQEAYYGYALWGAKAKTDRLETKYPQLLTPILQEKQIELNSLDSLENLTRMRTLSGSTKTRSSSSSISEALDFASILRAAQTLSSTIELDRLLGQIVEIILTNTGAQKAVLLVPQDDRWQLRATARITDNGTIETHTRSQLLTAESPVPIRLVQYVKNTLEAVQIDEAKTDIHGILEGYLLEYQPQSVLCVPMLDRGNLVAILYLEHLTTKGAFARDRQTVVRFLCTQAAIALQNAQLYERAQQSLCNLQKAQLQLVQSEKMSALGNLMAGVAHEINNPIGFLKGNIQPARDHVQDLLHFIDFLLGKCPKNDPQIEEEIEDIDLDFIRQDLSKLLGSMNLGVDRIRNISHSLRTFSRQDRDRKAAFDVREGIDSTLLILKHRMKANERRPAIRILKDYQEISEVQCFPGQLNQVFMNVLANAIDAFDEANRGKTYTELEKNPNCITIRTSIVGKNWIQIEIRDNGCGMKPETKDRIFEQGFTTKEVGKGTGLGMAIAQQIVTEKHGGTITCESVLGKGTQFEIVLPISG